jgi:hypothetical protein
VDRVDARTFSGWVAVIFLAWWIYGNPGDSYHLAANVEVLMSNSATGVRLFVTAI